MNDISSRGKNIALIVAAGSGSRSGQIKPKQYAIIKDKAMIAHSAASFASHPNIDEIYIVIGAGQEEDARAALASITIDGFIIGGETRQDSVFNGLKFLSEKNVRNIFIHDAARPNLPHGVIGRLLVALAAYKGAIPYLPMTDTIAHVENDVMIAAADRGKLGRIQTPQAFNYQDIWNAHQKARANNQYAFSDDAQIMHAMGTPIAIVDGDYNLHKYTFAEDFMTKKQVSQFRVGSGYDVHRFGAGEQLWLGGVQINSDVGLIGHSDADIVLHALTDALLGALSMGDIGDHFPPSDEQWRGTSSDIFMRHACKLMCENGYRISNADVTIICEAPKIGPHRLRIRQSIAQILDIDLDQISVKATTTEKLGFTGRGEGMAVQAQILIEKAL